MAVRGRWWMEAFTGGPGVLRWVVPSRQSDPGSLDRSASGGTATTGTRITEHADR